MLYGSQQEIEVSWKNSLIKGVFHGLHFLLLLMFAAINAVILMEDYMCLHRDDPQKAHFLSFLIPIFVVAHVVFALNMRDLYRYTRAEIASTKGDITPLLYLSYMGYRNYVHVLASSFIVLAGVRFLV